MDLNASYELNKASDILQSVSGMAMSLSEGS